MALTEAQAEANALGICPTCSGFPLHTPDCPAPRIGWADGTEVCDRCRSGLDAGEGYLAPTTERLGPFELADGITCLVCAFSDERSA